MNRILNQKRLHQLQQFHPKLENVWYLVASATFSVCNRPEEIPLIYHQALSTQNGKPIDDRAKIIHELLESNRSDSLKADSLMESINETYKNPIQYEVQITKKLREALLITYPLGGLPKAINSLSQLKSVTPSALLPCVNQDVDITNPNLNTDALFQDTLRANPKTIEEYKKVTDDGIKYWNNVYNKVSNKVFHNISKSYPDMIYFIIKHTYGPLFSFNKILNEKEKCLIIVSALVPQDVDAQLYGHLKGALNAGCDKEVVSLIQDMSIMISTWCGVRSSNKISKL
ncbi:hypothetical protein TBLA_0F02760 [Henningerozyma blattae CBS 6284]|uniref:Carboxymuconolactone decarboxylase-like domain-containing protein n=1 Tax=Henningerozyma blattae (strain ATCC 34711 / CBS 6284 / DSM 70876 / NBRC 10599 / NRRL Y-10934 / UCD 77-7) TaxID=1071380 RepID=I2H613_HENB6|nr:hypothetical protein TBLA_0F02760 [Tetrapisispora blattae CBS 6284]CCH61815.1 hypothetical protein TBLA_0F02760 [Tetrapisispora blattae CBS 6284]